MIHDVIKDLSTYFGSQNPPKYPSMKAAMGGAVNPSYFHVEYKCQKRVFQFWSVAGGSQREKDLAIALRDDIERFIRGVDHAVEQERVEESGISEHQDRDGGGQATEASGGDRPVGPAKKRGRPKKEVTNLQQG